MQNFEGSAPASGARNAMAAEAARKAFEDVEEDFEHPPAPLGDDEDPEPPAQSTPSAPQTGKRPVLSRPVKIRVNGVGITIPVVAHHVAARSICCILNEEGWDCDLPITNDVEVTIGDTTYKAAYLGGFHHFVKLGLQTIYFPLPGPQSEIDTQPPGA